MFKRILLAATAVLLLAGCGGTPKQKGAEPPVTEPKAPGQVTSITIESKALGESKKVNIYLPPGYDKSTERYPVVYLFRGHEREWVNPQEDGSRKGRTAATVADDLINGGTIGPVILVMPGLATDDNRIPGLGINFVQPELVTAEPTVGPGRFEDFMVREVIPAVDAQFRTLADRQHRGVDGFSLGGFTAVSLGLRFPDLFSSVGAFDGTMFWANATRPDGTQDSLVLNSMFRAAFGAPVNMERFRQVNPMDLVDAVPAETLQALTFHIHSGSEAAEPNASNFFRNQALVEKLKARGVANSFEPFALEGSSHNWWWADEHLTRSLVKHMQVFKR
jgi:enterochelin esterase-like enzyme